MRLHIIRRSAIFVLWALCGGILEAGEFGPPLPGTKPFNMTGDIASELVSGVDRFLLRQIDESTDRRAMHWKSDFSSPGAYIASVEPNRKRLGHILGVRDPRVSFDKPERFDGYSRRGTFGVAGGIEVHNIRWPAFGDVTGEGIEVTHPRSGNQAKGHIIVIPDADQTPESLLGMVPGVPPESQVARRLAQSGYHVIVPALIDRTISPRNARARLTNREFAYRSAFELGRHLIGYEVQKVWRLVDWLSAGSNRADRIGIFGYGEGGGIALYAGALDTRIDAVCVSGYFGDRNDVWRQPVDRNVFGLLERFGDAEITSLIAPRTLIVEAAKGPEVIIPPGTGRARKIDDAATRRGAPRSRTCREPIHELKPQPLIELVTSGPEGAGAFGSEKALQELVVAMTPDAKLAAPVGRANPFEQVEVGDSRLARPASSTNSTAITSCPDRKPRRSPGVHEEARRQLDPGVSGTIEPYRTYFADEVIGRFDLERMPPDVRRRRSTTSRISPATRWPWMSSPMSWPTESCCCPRESRGRKASGGRLPARPGRTAARCRRPEVEIQYITDSRSGWPNKVTSHSPPKTSTSRRPIPHPPAQGQPTQEDAVLRHRPPAPADHRWLVAARSSIRPGSPSTD